MRTMSRARVETGQADRQTQKQHKYREYRDLHPYKFQKYGLVDVTIRPKITDTVVARVKELSKGKVYFKKQEFIARDPEYEELSNYINTAIEDRAIELVEKLIEEEGRFEKEYEVVIDLDDRLEQLLQEAYREYKTIMNENELRIFFTDKIAPKLFTERQIELVKDHIDELKHYDDVEEAKKKLMEIADSVKSRYDLDLNILMLRKKIVDLWREIIRLRTRAMELENMNRELRARLSSSEKQA